MLRKKVMDYIESVLDTSCFTLKDCFLMPGGVYAVDATNKVILFYYDILDDKVKFEIEKEC